MKRRHNISRVNISSHAQKRFEQRYKQRVGALLASPKEKLRELMKDVNELPSHSKLADSIKHGSWGRHFIRKENGFYVIFVTNRALTHLLTVVIRKYGS